MTDVWLDREGGIGLLFIDRREKHNALTRAMYTEISALLREIDADDSIGVAIIHGLGGKAFSSGADLLDVHASASKETSWRPLHHDRFDAGLAIHKPIAAAIEGFCLAGGLELALFCDFRIAGEGSQFGAPEVRWNLLHGYGAQLLPRIVGISNTLYLLLTGLSISAEEGLRIGLVQEVVPANTSLERSRELAELIIRHAPMAVRMTKELVVRSRDMSLDDGLRLYQSLNRLVEFSEDLREGTRAFAEHRPPEYKGR